MKLSRTVAYAIEAMIRLAEADRSAPMPCSQLARTGQMPGRYLLQILRTLVTRGLLLSVRGVDGGYFLARQPEEITLMDIVDAFENPLTVDIPNVQGVSAKVKEKIVATLQHASQAARSELHRLTLFDLLPAQIEKLERANIMLPHYITLNKGRQRSQ